MIDRIYKFFTEPRLSVLSAMVCIGSAFMISALIW
jgi:hypothetical protein